MLNLHHKNIYFFYIGIIYWNVSILVIIIKIISSLFDLVPFT